MTTYHEHVPQTRRAVRESERASSEAQPEQFPFFSQTTPVAPSAPQPVTRGRRARPAAPEQPDALPPTQAIPAAERPSYRPRDFSPEGRRAAVQAWSAPAAPAAEAPAASAVPAALAPPSQSPSTPQQPWRPADSAPIEQTLSRRELRALREAQEAGSAAASPVIESPAAPAPAATGDAAYEALLAQMHEAARAPEPAVAAAVIAPQQVAPAPEPVAPAPATAAEASEPSLPQREVEPPAASTWTVPSNHWSRQLDLDQQTQPYESTINRVVGSAPATTNALMLPAIPAGDIRGALTATGEVMLTGSIDLASGFASTGSTRRMEHSGIDALFEQDDHEAVSTDSAPISAVRAVSTVGASSMGSLPAAPKQRGTRGLTILLVTACGLAAVVTGLVIAAFAFNLF